MRENAAFDERRLRDNKSDRTWSVWRGMRGENAGFGQSLRDENPQQVGDAQTSRNCVLPGRKGRVGLR